jgi:hypothetical protein
MRLVSKNNVRDYYDKMISFGIDPAVVYVRKRELFTLSWNADARLRNIAQSAYGAAMRHCRFSLENSHSARYEEKAHKGFVGFCGVLYPFLCVYTKKAKLEVWQVEDFIYGKPGIECYDKQFFYSEEDILRFSEKNPEHPGIQKLMKEERIAGYFQVSEYGAIFDELEVPLVAVSDEGLHVNPCLQDFSFARVKPGEQAFQEISAYISGVLNTKNAMKISKLSDTDMAVSKGFDKRSFRRDPQKRRV